MTPDEPFTELEVAIPTGGSSLAGTLTVPAGPPRPAVLLIGGTFSDLRDGDADPRQRPDIPPHGMYRVLAHALAQAGLAVLRFDRRGCGASGGYRPSRAEEIDDAAAAWGWLDVQPEVARAFAMVGESAGAYVLCRLATAGHRPRAAVLQGALHRSILGLLEFNLGRARAYYERGPEARAWMWQHARREYETAVLAEPVLVALRDGDLRTICAADERGTFQRELADLRYDVDHPPAAQLATLTCPVLVLHGADDLNVPPEDAFDTAAALWRAGNRAVAVVMLSRADHSLQSTPAELEERLRERMSFASFRRPFHPRHTETVVSFLCDQLRSSLP